MRLQEDNGRWVFDTELGQWFEHERKSFAWSQELLLVELMHGCFSVMDILAEDIEQKDTNETRTTDSD